MAYTRKYRRTRKTTRKLSNYNIATKTSAKAQSKQIYALKKRVNAIYRMTRPETEIQTRTSQATTLNANATGLISFRTISDTSYDNNIEPIAFRVGTPSSTSGDGGKNDFIRSRSLQLYGNWQYGTVASDNTPVTLRIVITQLKKSRAQELTASDIFTFSNNPLTFASVFGPLQDGITATVRVLSDKRYNLNFQRPNVNIRTTLRYLYNFRRDAASGGSNTSDSETIDAGTINVFYAIYSPATTMTSSSLQLMYKLAFTDN